tara:strand:+ start:206 stop:610 length:405 start_codon:yes stop_codon:yes gene_type:complete
MKLTDALKVNLREQEREAYQPPILNGIPRRQNLWERAENLQQSNDWTVQGTPPRLSKTFHFESLGNEIRFVTELLEYQEEIQHHALITIDGSAVTIEVWTHDLEDVTELDREYAAEADAAYADILAVPDVEEEI